MDALWRGELVGGKRPGQDGAEGHIQEPGFVIYQSTQSSSHDHVREAARSGDGTHRGWLVIGCGHGHLAGRWAGAGGGSAAGRWSRDVHGPGLGEQEERTRARIGGMNGAHPWQPGNGERMTSELDVVSRPEGRRE